jgi:hypothetical protein
MASMNYFDLAVQIWSCTLMRKAMIYMITFVGKVMHILCDADWLFYLLPCQIQADNNSPPWESLIDGTAITIILCFHVLITHRIFINFGYVDYFQ